MLIFGVLTFAYSTILGWCYYATQCVEYLFSSKMTKIYMFIWIVVIFLGSIGKIQVVWDIADILNALMVIPNILAILFLTKKVKQLLHEYHHDFLPKHPEG